MELELIKSNLHHPDFQYRLKAIAALKNYSPEIAVPLLQTKIHDPEFLVRSFVAMAFGKQQTAESFASLLEMIRFDDTPNVRAEAANSLSLFGAIAISHLVSTFYQDDHWLVRRSILAALTEMDCPDELFDICQQAIAHTDEDETVQESAVDALATLADTHIQEQTLNQLLDLVNHPSERIRIRVAYALKLFEQETAKSALQKLRQDPDHQVVGAALENLLPS